jgi:hypothetical protein
MRIQAWVQSRQMEFGVTPRGGEERDEESDE